MSKNREYAVGETIETYGHSDYWESRFLKDGYKFSIVDVNGDYVKYEIEEVIEPVTDAEKRAMLHKILDVILDINEGVVTRCGAGHPTAFFDYSGHTNGLDVRIYQNGWTSDSHDSDNFDINFDEPTLYTANKVYDELVNIRKNLYPED